MFKTYFKLAFRNIIKDKAYSIINVSGLAIGLASSILILLWVQNELSYDTFQKNAGQIYRISGDWGDFKAAVNAEGMPAGLKEIPVVKYGLSAFMTEQRTKEIGIRKVLGASVINLVYLLSTGMTRLIFTAIVIAIPLSWYAVNSWLAGFAYHIQVSWLVFFTASLVALSIAWLTVSYESVKAAIVNPVKSLRTD